MVKKIRLDFSKVEERSGWNTKQMPEGLHKFKVASVQESEASDGTPMLVYSLVPADPRYKTRNFPFYCKLQQNQLWKLRDLLVAAGGTVPKKAGNVDPNQPVGKFIAAEVEDETGQYAGHSTINGTYSLDILDENSDGIAGDDDDEEEYDESEEADEVDEDEDEEEEDEEEDEEDDEDLTLLGLPELRKIAKELGVTTTGLKKDGLIEAIEEARDEEEDEDDLDDEDLEDEDLDDEELYDDEDEEEEEEPAPKRKAPARKPAAAAPAKRTVRRR